MTVNGLICRSQGQAGSLTRHAWQYAAVESHGTGTTGGRATIVLCYGQRCAQCAAAAAEPAAGKEEAGIHETELVVRSVVADCARFQRMRASDRMTFVLSMSTEFSTSFVIDDDMMLLWYVHAVGLFLVIS